MEKKADLKIKDSVSKIWNMNGPKRIADDSSSFIVWVVLNPCREMVEI